MFYEIWNGYHAGGHRRDWRELVNRRGGGKGVYGETEMDEDFDSP